MRSTSGGTQPPFLERISPRSSTTFATSCHGFDCSRVILRLGADVSRRSRGGLTTSYPARDGRNGVSTRRISVDGRDMESPTHAVDCFKTRVALEIEWNNKDPFFDRDLNNFRLLFDLRVISVGIIITRCDELQEIFDSLGRGKSYGASTTHMSKLLPRIQGGGGAGCPLLVFGIRRSLYVRIFQFPQVSAAEDLLSKMQGPFSTILRRSPVAIYESNGKDGSRTPTAAPLFNHDIGGDFCVARKSAGRCTSPPLSVGAERANRRRLGGNETVGLYLQDQSSLV